MTDPLSLLSPLSGRRWVWRTPAEHRDRDLADQLLLARGCPPDALADHRQPTLRAFMPDPSLFLDMDRAAARLADAVEAGEAMSIFGDYDVDGATSAALLARLLRALGLAPGLYIPDRQKEGYGPSIDALLALGDGGSRLIVTVDCGAQAFEALAAAQEAGLEVIVVDHHQCAETLPATFAMVNPNRRDEGPARVHGHLAAVGVAFLLGAALIRTLRTRGFFGDRAEPRLLALLDLVALGTVADVAPLCGLNRAFVAQGLKVMAERRNLGLATLADVAGLKAAPQASDLGFALGPRINAGGRVGRSDLGVRLLTTEDPVEARTLAEELNALNQERRAIEAVVQAEAELQAALQADAPVIIVAGAGWHAGVIGIVAGRLKERHGRPAIVIAMDEATGEGKGSGRSIPGVDLGAAILAAKQAGLLVAGGGHAMAAGLTINANMMKAFMQHLHEGLGEAIARARMDQTLALDAVVSPRGVNPLLVKTLETGAPYGMGWPAPRIAAGPFRLLEAARVGTDHVRALLAGEDGARLKAIAFRAAESLLGQALLGAQRDRTLWVAGRARRDDWGRQPVAELHLDDLSWAE